ncbi:MAG: phosphoribosylglycinamide formyltransferase [Lachnospiraceae bacterium]|nr:phosphoribosylglycinamide formyltransferase [Lachnospiraceae bacterium]
MLKIVVLVSGGGTNLQAILDRAAAGSLGDVKITCVISNNRGVKALDRAEQAGIPHRVVSPKDYPDREAFNEALLAAVESAEPDLVVLAGFLVAIPPAMVQAFPHRIINIHPSLIPAFCGKGYYGLKVHEAALRRGVRVTGATVHFVDEGTDTGPIILQKPVAVQQGDTPEILQRRVMEEAEWEILPEAIALIAAGAVSVEDGRVIIDRSLSGKEEK